MTEHERLIYTFAKYCWANRDKTAPNIEAGRKWTWAEIFYRRTGKKLSDYAAERQVERNRSEKGA